MSMLAAIALAGTLASPQAKGVPEPHSIVYSGIPGMIGDAEVRMDSHSVTMTIGNGSVTVDTLTLLKNTRAADSAVKVKFPWTSRCTNDDFLVPPSTLAATWDKTALKLEPDWRDVATANLGPRFRQKVYLADVTIKANATHALRVHYTMPLGRGGLDNLLRVAAYGTTYAEYWHGPIGRFQISLKYSPQTVFQVYSAMPNWGWQIGPNGAFLRKDGLAQGGEVLLFSFYPGGFQGIGGKDAKGGGGGLG
ncbi:MAG: hypothetical protein M9921_04440 [Fimbriimonadaceae bacterium]|nr:hypothetical protein [Fimbriimonadaceae bacterium]